jgi:hypothetical protein
VISREQPSVINTTIANFKARHVVR